MLSDFMCNVYNNYASGLIFKESLPYFVSRVGLWSKLIPFENVVSKLREGKLIDRCLVILDALNRRSPPCYIMHLLRPSKAHVLICFLVIGIPCFVLPLTRSSYEMRSVR